MQAHPCRSWHPACSKWKLLCTPASQVSLDLQWCVFISPSRCISPSRFRGQTLNPSGPGCVAFALTCRPLTARVAMPRTASLSVTILPACLAQARQPTGHVAKPAACRQEMLVVCWQKPQLLILQPSDAGHSPEMLQTCPESRFHAQGHDCEQGEASLMRTQQMRPSLGA